MRPNSPSPRPPYWNDGETVDVIDDEVDAEGEERTENVPMPGERPDTEGQSTFEDWRISP